MKRFTLSLAAILLLLLVAPSWHAAVAKDTWTSVHTKNFLLIGNTSEKEIKQVGAKLEQFREVFSLLFPRMNFNSPVATTVIVFKSDSSFRPFKPNSNVAGYFQSGTDVNYIALTTEKHGEQDPFNVIFHEYTHLLVNNTVGNVPTWFNEGLAEYYSTFSITDDQKLVLGSPIASHVFLLRENKMLPLKTLFQVDQHSPYYNERDKQSIFYAESWALMHYLIHGKNGGRMVQMDEFVNLTNANVPMEQAFQKAFQMTPENMEKELRDYIKRDSYPVINGHFKSKLDFDKETQSAPLSEAESQAYLGDLLLHSNRTDAESYLQKALELDPNLAMAQASMGMLRMREGKFEEARQNLERAAAKSQNYLIHYYYAYALSREGMDETQTVRGYDPETASKMREELHQAITLRPDFPEAYKQLVFVNLVTGTDLDESADLLKRLLGTSPGRNDVVFLLAQVYMRKEDYKAARQLLERVAQSQTDAQLSRQAQTILDQLASREEQIARFEAMRNSAGSDGAPRLARRGDGAPPTDPSAVLQASLRKMVAGEARVQGMLLRIECDAKGITFFVKVDDRTLKLHTDRFENLTITAFTTDAGREITCGPRNADSVVVSYLPSESGKAKFDGEAKSIEFVPKDFKLKVQT